MATANNGAQWRAMGAQIARQVGVPWNVFDALVNQESGWNPSAKSPVGAIGFTQLMPGTAQGLGVDPSNPAQNLRGGAIYLKKMLDAFGGSVPLALAAYNAGPGAVQKYGGIPPYAETQNYVKSIMAASKQGAANNMPGAAWGGGEGDQGKPLPPGSPAPTGLAGMIPFPGLPPGQSLGTKAGLMSFAAPTQGSVDILSKLGGTAGRIQQANVNATIPTPQEPAAAPQIPGMPTVSGGKDGGLQLDFPPVIPVGGGLRGQVPMHTGGNIAQSYPNLAAMSHVDWQHVNPRLLQVLQKLAEKHGFVISLNSGYRSSGYNKSVGGAENSRHMSGLAVDAYVNGHPIGEVIPPEEWAKYGIRSGNQPGFFKGKPDPEHIDMAGIPIKQSKGGPKA